MASRAILVIDDDTALREGLIDFLGLFLGITIYAAANGREGLQLFQEQDIALVLLDLDMPVMNGEQTYKKLQEIAPPIKIIISSGRTYAEVRQRFVRQEMPTFLPKPYDIDRLLTVVKTELAAVQN
jgi:DNA-binding NtrC family response regulator